MKFKIELFMTKKKLIEIIIKWRGHGASWGDVLTAIDAYASTAKPNVELPRGVKLCDCPECGAEIQYGLAQDVIDKFNKVFGTKGAKPNVSGELPSDESKKCDYHAVFTFCGDNGVTYCSNCGDPL